MRFSISLFFFLFLSCSTTRHQTPPNSNEWSTRTIDKVQVDFRRGMELLSHDSIYEAVRYLLRVAEFDSAGTMGQVAQQQLDSIAKKDEVAFLEQISGTWRWIWTGTNWGTEDSPKRAKTERYLRFSGNQLQQLTEDSVVATRPFRVIQDPFRSSIGLRLIRFDDTHETWQIALYDHVVNSYYLAERSPDAPLFFNYRTELNCVCGCREIWFEKTPKGIPGN